MTAPVLVPPESARARFLRAVTEQLGKPVVWAAKAPEAFDCSELVAWGLNVASGGKLQHGSTHTAQRYHDETRPLQQGEPVLPGDLAFFGVYEQMRDASGAVMRDDSGEPRTALRIVHVEVCDDFEGTISADGATSAITSLAVALANPANRVRRHPKRRHRKEPYFAVHRNTFVDEADNVSR